MYMMGIYRIYVVDSCGGNILAKYDWGILCSGYGGEIFGM
jgi:hypothetical protein